jgi:hypothetical protein
MRQATEKYIQGKKNGVRMAPSKMIRTSLRYKDMDGLSLTFIIFKPEQFTIGLWSHCNKKN